MKESYGEGLATHTGPESCGAAREGGVEAWTGERMGRVFSRVRTLLRGADACRRKRKAAPGVPISRGASESRAVRDPVHVRKHLAREPGDPLSARGSQCSLAAELQRLGHQTSHRMVAELLHQDRAARPSRNRRPEVSEGSESFGEGRGGHPNSARQIPRGMELHHLPAARLDVLFILLQILSFHSRNPRRAQPASLGEAGLNSLRIGRDKSAYCRALARSFTASSASLSLQ
jgi:hypothetical protein